MFEQLENFLGRYAGPEKTGMCMAAMHRLETYGLVSARSEISQLLNTANSVDTMQLLLDIEVIINSGLNSILEQHQIQAKGNIPIKTDILEGLKVLMDYEDSATILQFCDLSSDPIETLSDMLSMVTDRSWADYTDALESVSHALIKRLGDLHRERGEAMQTYEVTEIEPERKLALQKHMHGYVVSLTKAALLENLTMIGTPFDILINNYKEALAEFEPRAARQAAIELVGFSLLSDTPLNDFVRTTKDKIDDVYSDINFITQVDIEIDNVIREVMGRG